MNAPTDRPYVLGTGDEELVRLGFQHRVWSEQAFGIWSRAGFGPSQTLLDVGCGPGYTSLDLAHLVGPQGRVMAIDHSERFISHLKDQQQAQGLNNIDARVGDAQQLDVPEGTIDGAYARWLLCFLDDPEAVVAGVAGALKPGGVFAVQDYFHYLAVDLAPHSAAFRRVVEAVHESWAVRGGSIDVGTRVPEMMDRCGISVKELKPILRVARPGSALWRWPETFFRNFMPTLVEMGLITADDQRAFEVDWSARSDDPNALFITPPMLDIIGVKR
jgi:SAM-dependent methyltransferase